MSMAQGCAYILLYGLFMLNTPGAVINPRLFLDHITERVRI